MLEKPSSTHSSRAAARVPGRQRRKAARPAELTAAALEVFVERGYAATRLEDIAARAGVSKSTLYLYFENKEELFKAVIREGFEPALAQGLALLKNYRGSAADLVREFIHGWYEFIGSKPVGGLTKLMIGDAQNFPEIAVFYHDEAIAPALALIRKVLQLGVKSGEFRRIVPDTVQHIVFAPLLMFTVWRHSIGSCCGSRIDPTAYVENCIQLALYGLSAGSPADNGRKISKCAS